MDACGRKRPERARGPLPRQKLALQSQILTANLQRNLHSPARRLRWPPVHGEPCSWCGATVDPEDGLRAAEPAGERKAAFCRLEHVVPWAMHGAHWDAGTVEFQGDDPALSTCAQCGEAVDDARVLLVRHRGEFRVADAFCGVDHLEAWARAGGRYS